jgi:hypothetical protein
MQKKSSNKDLVLHKLVDKHDWVAIASFSDPFLYKCSVCGITESDPNKTNSLTSTTYVTGSGGGFRHMSTTGSVLTLSGINQAYTYFMNGDAKQDVYMMSPAQFKMIYDES